MLEIEKEYINRFRKELTSLINKKTCMLQNNLLSPETLIVELKKFPDIEINDDWESYNWQLDYWFSFVVGGVQVYLVSGSAYYGGFSVVAEV